MESRISGLLEKYWEGKTSLTEEEEIHRYFKENPHLTAEGMYFQNLQKMKSVKSTKNFSHPEKKIQRRWMSVAATIILGITVAFFVIQDARKQREYVIEDPQEAYEMTRKALMMVSSGLNEGAEYSTELKKINKAEKIVSQEE